MKISPAMTVLYFGDVAIALYWIYVYSGYSLHPPEVILHTANTIIFLGVIKSILYISTIFVVDRVWGKFDMVSLGIGLIILSGLCLLFFATTSYEIVSSSAGNISPALYHYIETGRPMP